MVPSYDQRTEKVDEYQIQAYQQNPDFALPEARKSLDNHILHRNTALCVCRRTAGGAEKIHHERAAQPPSPAASARPLTLIGEAPVLDKNQHKLT